jgi:putative tryptophan/tyrosine transport system substrate-binding protein
MRRRDLILGFAVTACVMWPARTVYAQAARKPLRLGIVHPVSPKDVPPYYVAFVGRLRELGYVEGDTLEVEYINLEGYLERYDQAMRELVRRRVDVIFALGQEQNLRAALTATSTIPIVMLALTYDPIAKGLVSNLARPTGNVTGIYILSIEILKKRLQLLMEAVPETRAAFGFWDFDAAETWRAAADAAPLLGITLTGVELREPPYDYERAFQQVAPKFRGALFLPDSVVFLRDAERRATFALRHRMASSFHDASFVNAGGLMSYGADRATAARRAAEFVDRIARGAKPSNLPIEQSTRFVLSINLKTAKVLGITIPQSVLLRADEVIQ